MLHPRVNHEALCDCRPVFYAALAERLRSLPEEAAILEINRWCAEHVAYQPTDERTRSALAVLRAGFGRCGEESMFAVNVLRACGFAARQVYVPRWAHCDDNHAWVEVRCGGAWHFLGACEPEAVLDRGWFNSAAGRAVLVHSRCFGEPEPGADLIGREGDVVYCNETARYADVRRLTVRVTDENGMSAAGANVDFCVLNNCEWYPAATVQTDASGMAALTCGLGSLRLLTRRDGLCCEAFVSPEETGPVVLTLGKRAPAPDRWEAMAVKNLNYNYYLNVSDYIAVDFEQLAEIIDRIGGVTVNIDEDEARYLSGYPNVHVGDCLLDGETAVSYARIRKSSATDSDRKRTGRQREVILSILNTLQTMPLSQYPGFVRDCLGMCATSFEAETLLTMAAETLGQNYTVEQYFFPEGQVDWWAGLIKEYFYYVYDLRRASDRIYRIIYEELYISGYDD